MDDFEKRIVLKQVSKFSDALLLMRNNLRNEKQCNYIAQYVETLLPLVSGLSEILSDEEKYASMSPQDAKDSLLICVETTHAREFSDELSTE